MADTLSFLEGAARLEAMVKGRRTASLQEVADIAVEVARQHAALLRFLHSEFPDAAKIREAVFEHQPKPQETT